LVLKHIKQWLQEVPYKLSFGLMQLFDAYDPEPEIQELFDKLEEHVNTITGSAYP
jgi:hypothetical protein